MKKIFLIALVGSVLISCGPHRMRCGPNRCMVVPEKEINSRIHNS